MSQQRAQARPPRKLNEEAEEEEGKEEQALISTMSLRRAASKVGASLSHSANEKGTRLTQADDGREMGICVSEPRDGDKNDYIDDHSTIPT